MVVVSVSFALCFVCQRTYTILTRLGVAPSLRALRMLFAVFSYSNRCLNPFVYATQYDVVRRWWRVAECRLVCGGQHVDDPATTPHGSKHQQVGKIHVTTKNI